ncbi:uncharacterized protein TrAtP1_002341 [Trichoderma atroviride]|uniref:uncharacterized protein n=1 Tax=Hypocrea atroviridis TaxID=63577 RepID=UPI00331D66FE|nr:hypothetical protein TrAtP1_002341 [Trichoderma atroviride]
MSFALEAMDFLRATFEYLRQLYTQILRFLVFLIHIQFEGFRVETLMSSRLPELYLIMFGCLAICRIYFTFRLGCVFADTVKKFILLLITESFGSETGVMRNGTNATLPTR